MVEGPFKVTRIIQGNSYFVEDLEGKKLPKTLNGKYTKKFYPRRSGSGGRCIVGVFLCFSDHLHDSLKSRGACVWSRSWRNPGERPSMRASCMERSQAHSVE
jgi:hypothetical protein